MVTTERLVCVDATLKLTGSKIDLEVKSTSGAVGHEVDRGGEGHTGTKSAGWCTSAVSGGGASGGFRLGRASMGGPAGPGMTAHIVPTPTCKISMQPDNASFPPNATINGIGATPSASSRESSSMVSSGTGGKVGSNASSNGSKASSSTPSAIAPPSPKHGTPKVKPGMTASSTPLTASRALSIKPPTKSTTWSFNVSWSSSSACITSPGRTRSTNDTVTGPRARPRAGFRQRLNGGLALRRCRRPAGLLAPISELSVANSMRSQAAAPLLGVHGGTWGDISAVMLC
mmetsp:Transcript_24026/g.48261  ORF Transcript_24026/g.48261 Transcript_24026/m.48261 type:complete len:287 (+) Transcript_24026:227-1087(+)